MQAKIQERNGFTVLGIQLTINPMVADYSDIWLNQYEPRVNEVRAHATDEACVGVYFDCGKPNMVDFVAGAPVSGVAQPPEGLVLREVPPCTEAVFECNMATIGQTWEAIFRQWMPASGYRVDESSPCFERFAPGCHEGRVPVTIHVPVTKA